MNRRFFIITSCLVSLVSVGGNSSPAFATKLNARPLPSERELKDFENSAAHAPEVSRFSRRLDYREQEKLQKEQDEAAKKEAMDRAAKQEQQQVAASKKSVQAALDANNRGVALGKAGRWNDAIQAHESAVQFDPQNKQYRINLSAARCAFGQDRLAAKDLQAAAGLFRKSLVAAPDNGLAAKLLNETMKKQGHDPTVVEERVAIGDQLLAVNEFDTALLEYQAAMQLESSARTFTKMGDVALRCGQLSTAANWYSQAIVKDANYGPAHRQMGLVQLNMHDQTGAAASLRKAIILDSKDSLAGQALVDVWRRQVAANPLMAENHLGLAGALQLTGDFNGAEDEYNKLATLEPGNPGLAAGRASLNRARQHGTAEKHRLASETLFNQGLKREALAEIGQAVMIEPKNARFQFLLGECLEANGDLRGAHQAYMTCVLIDPAKNQEAAYRMKEMQKASMPMAAPPMQSMQAAAPQYVAPQQARNVQAPQAFQKNMFEGGNGVQNAVAKTQMGFSTHDESMAAPAQHANQQVAAHAPAHAAAKPADGFAEFGPETVARLNEMEGSHNFDGAVALLRELSGRNIRNADVHHRLAVDLLGSGNVTEAISEFRIASALNPVNRNFAADLARAMEIHKRSQENAFEDASGTTGSVSASGKEVAAK